MILTIIGSVFAGVQILIAAIGASGMDLKYHEERYKCDDKTGNYKEYSVVCREVMQRLFEWIIIMDGDSGGGAGDGETRPPNNWSLWDPQSLWYL